MEGFSVHFEFIDEKIRFLCYNRCKFKKRITHFCNGMINAGNDMISKMDHWVVQFIGLKKYSLLENLPEILKNSVNTVCNIG